MAATKEGTAEIGGDRTLQHGLGQVELAEVERHQCRQGRRGVEHDAVPPDGSQRGDGLQQGRHRGDAVTAHALHQSGGGQPPAGRGRGRRTGAARGEHPIGTADVADPDEGDRSLRRGVRQGLRSHQLEQLGAAMQGPASGMDGGSDPGRRGELRVVDVGEDDLEGAQRVVVIAADG